MPSTRKRRKPPLCVTAAGKSAACLGERYSGAACFLFCGGPSLAGLDERLQRETGRSLQETMERRGVLTAAVNQIAATHVRPKLWFCVDAPGSFHEAIWEDPGITKFAKRSMSRHSPRRWNEQSQKWVGTGKMIRHYPDVWFYEHGYGFDPATFLTHDRVVWGGDAQLRPGVKRQTKSVMLVALRLLFWMGCRTIYLCGADFRMEAGRSYAFDQQKDGKAAGYNNNSYRCLNGFFERLRPQFEKHGCEIVNLTRNSGLTAFDRGEFDDALERAASRVPEVHTVSGLYGGPVSPPDQKAA